MNDIEEKWAVKEITIGTIEELYMTNPRTQNLMF